MTAPVDSFAIEVYDKLEPVAHEDEQNGWALSEFVSALGTMFQQVDTLVSDTDAGPGWSQVMDVNRVPSYGLSWLAQFVGVTVDPTIGDSAQRTRIKSTDGFKRGTPGAMIAAAQSFLTGGKTVILRERNGSPWLITVVTRTVETPIADIPTTNLVANGGFESNTTGWQGGTGVTLSQDLTAAFDRLASAKIIYSNSPTNGVMIATTGSAIFLGPGQVATLSFRWKAPVGAQMTASIHFQLGGAGPNLSTATAVVIGTGDWQYVTLTETAPATTDRCRPQFTGNAAFTANLDTVQLELLPLATGYVETNGATASRAAGLGPVGAALRAQKPAGLVLTYNVILGQDYTKLKTDEALYSNMFSDYSNYTAVLNDTA